MEIASAALNAHISKALRPELEALLGPYYQDAGRLLDRELEKCDTIYTARDHLCVLQAFFMVSRHTLRLNDLEVPAVYLGLSANRSETRRSFRVAELYERFLADAQSQKQASGKSPVLWFTTATPAAYIAAESLFSELEPDRSGRIAEQSREIFAVLRQMLGAAGEDERGMAVLPQIARDTLYSADEMNTIARIVERTGCTILADCGVDSTAGDRLLCVCRTPHSG
jgi:hypothetical protein